MNTNDPFTWDDRMIHLKELCAMLDISMQIVRREIRKGTFAIRAMKIGGRYRFLHSEVRLYIFGRDLDGAPGGVKKK